MLPSRDGVARVALVQAAATLLSGDRLELDVRCAPDSRLEIVEVAGLVAHDVRDGAPADVELRAALAAGARLSWAAQPFVLAQGCDVRRTTAIELAAGAAMLLRDTLVLGRTGQVAGRLRAGLTVAHAGRELHVETLDTGDRELLRSPVVLGGARVLDALGLYGRRAPDPDALQLAGPGTLLPVAATTLSAAERRTAAAAAAWRSLLFSPPEQAASTCSSTNDPVLTSRTGLR